MMNFKSQFLEKSLISIIIGASLLVTLVPLIIVPQSYFPYIIQKTIILRILIEFILCAYLVLVFLNPEYRPRKSLMFWTVLAFMAVMIITTLTSQSVFRSWWGNWERSFGTFTYLHYFAWFIVLISVFKKKVQWNRILNASLLASLLMCLYSLAQRFSVLSTFEAGLKRVNGTIGNASFLASYLLFHIFIALLFLIEKKDWKWRTYYAVVFAADFFVILLTGTRGALLSIFASILVFLFLTVRYKVWRFRSVKILLALCLALFIGVGFTFYHRDTPLVRNNYWLKRLTSFSLNDNTIQTRFHTWSWGTKGFRDYLLTGVGPENYQIVFNRYFEGDFYDYSRNEIWFDRAHNTLVDMASTMGIFGLLGYLALFVAIFYYLYHLFKRGQLSLPVYCVMILLFFSYFLQNLFVFDSLNSLIVFYLLLAFLNYVYNQNQEKIAEKRTFHLPTFSVYLTAPLSLVIFLTLLLTVNVPEIKANLYTYDAFVEGRYNNYERSVSGYLAAYDVAVNKLDPAILLSSSLNEMIGANSKIASKEREIADIKTAISWMEKAIALDSKDMFLYYNQAKNYSLLAEISNDAQYVTKGFEINTIAHELSPGRVRPYWLMAQLYLFSNEPQKALEALDRAWEINKNLPETYFYRAIVFKTLGDQDNYNKQFEGMIDNNYQFYSVAQVKEVLPYFEAKSDYPRLVYLFTQLTQLDGKDPNSWNGLVNVLETAGRYDEALAALQSWADALPGSSSNAYARYQEILKKKNNEQNQSNQ